MKNKSSNIKSSDSTKINDSTKRLPGVLKSYKPPPNTQKSNLSLLEPPGQFRPDSSKQLNTQEPISKSLTAACNFSQKAAKALSDTSNQSMFRSLWNSFKITPAKKPTSYYKSRKTRFPLTTGWGCMIGSHNSAEYQSQSQEPSNTASVQCAALDCCNKIRPSTTLCYTDRRLNENNNNMPDKTKKNNNTDANRATLKGNFRFQHSLTSNFGIPLSLSTVSDSPQISTSSVPNSSSFNGGGPLDSLQLVNPNQSSSAKQQNMIGSQRQQRNYFDRQKIKLLKPLAVTKPQNSANKLYDITTSEFSAAILPDSNRSSAFRLKHDVSFDEGSRYRNIQSTENFSFSQNDLKNNGNRLSPNNSRMDSRRHLCSMPSPAHVSFKETMPLSLIRMEDRLNEIPLAAASSPVTPTNVSPSVGPFTGLPTQKQGLGSSAPTNGGTITTFRLHKGKANWNCKLGELSINGGGFYGSTNIRDSTSYASINTSSTSNQIQKNSCKERNSITLKSQMSSRYGKSEDTKTKDKEAVYQDPCIGAAPSYQQRLMDLSMLESETVKYERNRRLRRKKNQDKDS